MLPGDHILVSVNKWRQVKHLFRESVLLLFFVVFDVLLMQFLAIKVAEHSFPAVSSVV